MEAKFLLVQLEDEKRPALKGQINGFRFGTPMIVDYIHRMKADNIFRHVIESAKPNYKPYERPKKQTNSYQSKQKRYNTGKMGGK